MSGVKPNQLLDRSARLLLPVLLLGSLSLSETLVISRVTLIDATDRGRQPDMNVSIEGDRIISISSWGKAGIDKGASVIDGRGKFLIPGLWDMHVHGSSDARSSWSNLLFVANGVVGVRDMAGPPDAGAWRTQHASALERWPSIYLGSPIVDGPNPVWPDSIVVASEAQGRAVVDEQQHRGADFIKVYARLPRPVYQAIAEEARKRGISFAGHVPESITAAEASDAGQKSIEHLTSVAAGCSSQEHRLLAELQEARGLFRAPRATLDDKLKYGRRMLAVETREYQTFNEAAARSLFSKFVSNDTWQCPTLTELRAELDLPLSPHDPRLEYLSGRMRASFEAGFYRGLPATARSGIVDVARPKFENSRELIGRMRHSGVHLLAGTDAMTPQCFPGFSLHDELVLLVDAGLTPLEALQTATRNAAQFMGQLERRGTIESGKVADLVLLDKDPLIDIHNTRTIQAVVLRGKLLPRAALDALLTEASNRAKRTDEGLPEK